MVDALQALRRVDFDWTEHIDQIWADGLGDVVELQPEARQELQERLDDLVDSRTEKSPLGVPLLGSAGSGKTHLLGVLRQQVDQKQAYFVLVDMTDVKDFWETVLLGYLRSLQQRTSGGRRQVDIWLSGIITRYGSRVRNAVGIPQQRPPKLINTCNELIAVVTAKHPEEAREHSDVLRALILFACDHPEINDLGYKWLQGIGIDDDERSHHGFREAQRSPSRIVRGLSWLLALGGPTVLCLDQLDAIVAEHNLAAAVVTDEPSEQQQASNAIIQGIAGGLMALRDVTRRTLTVVSTLQVTWEILSQRATVSMVDRFWPALHLDASNPEHAVRHLVLLRLQRGYKDVGFEPHYPTYPFRPRFFEKYKANTPREVLKVCDSHRRSCRKAGMVSELGSEPTIPPPTSHRSPDWTRIRALVKDYEQKANLDELLADDSERSLDLLIETGCQSLIVENPLPGSILPQLDREFMATGQYDPLHARIRLILTHQAERERHHSFRFLQKQHHIAFQSRLKAAITASGIDQALGFRRLSILRVGAPPSGPATQRVLKELTDRGGQLIEPSPSELRLLWALSQLLRSEKEPNDLDEWLQAERPVSRLPCFELAAQWLFDDLRSLQSASTPSRPSATSAAPVPIGAATPASAPRSETALVGQAQPSVLYPQDAAVKRDTDLGLGPPGYPAPAAASSENAQQGAAASTEIPVGRLVSGGTADGTLRVSLGSLTNHTCVLAGSGSGKTVFLRRIVEEAALVGVPSIVIDGANDLSRLGDSWPTRPADFTDEDQAKAERYHEAAEVVVWTPGIASGNPLVFNPIPDFASIASSFAGEELLDQRSAAVEMARASLEPLVAPGNSAKDKKARAILASALRSFALGGGGTLDALIGTLREPPDEVTEGYSDGEKISEGISELLLSATKTDPLLSGGGVPLDPASLLRSQDGRRTRVSVINLSGLSGLDAQQKFLNQLAMTLFTWIKKHPAKDGSLLGLLVLDEAKDFVPSGKSVPCRSNIIRLTAQARKYGLGMLFATQAPKSIDHNVVANCSTLIVGRTNSPAAIDTIQQLLQNKGGGGGDVAKLPRGTFYASTVHHPRPVKVLTSLCLSHHPSSPPDESEVIARARRSRGADS